MDKKLKINIIVKSVLGIFLLFLLFPQINFFLSSEMKESLLNEYKTSLGFASEKTEAVFTVEKFICAIAIFILVYLVITLIAFLIDKLCSYRKRSKTVAGLIISIVKTVAYIAYFAWVLSLFGVNVVAIFASLGILSLIVGFGVQSLIEDCITGIFIIIEGDYNIGDIIVLDDFRGKVKKINLRTTTIEDDGGNLKIINNSDIRNIQNRSNNSSLAVCEVGISYEEDLLRVEEIIKKALPKIYEANKDAFTSVPRYAGVQSLGSSAVVLKILADCKESNIFSTQRLLNREIKILFDANNINIPYNQLVVHNSSKN